MTEPANETVYVRIPEISRRDMPLGRHVEHDPRSRNFPFSAISPDGDQVNYVIRDSEWADTSGVLPLNQLTVGKCTAEATCGSLDCAPNWTGARYRPYNDVDSDQLYRQETSDEGHPWPMYDPGGSGLAVCKAAKELGWISGYRHTFSMNHALHALNWRPVITGVNWYDSFDSPDDNGLITITPNASVRGGHEVLGVQVLAEQQLVGLWNSWGTDYGKGGRFWISWSDFDRLLSEQGDVTVPLP